MTIYQKKNFKYLCIVISNLIVLCFFFIIPLNTALAAELADNLQSIMEPFDDDCSEKYGEEYFEAQSRAAAAKNKNIAAPAGEVSIIIDTFRRKLIVLNDNKYFAQFPVAIGKAESPSPIGNWQVVQKGINSGPALGTRWLGLNVPWGIYGIHGTNKPWSIGSMASQGCFRMWNENVEIIYPWIKKNSSVTVVGNPFGYMSGGLQTLNSGDKGSAVWYVQEKLSRLGFYEGKPDGLFGSQTEKAVREFQKYSQLTQTGQVGFKEYAALKLW